MKCSVAIFFIAYFVLVLLIFKLYVSEHIEKPLLYWFSLLFLPLFNLILIVWLGRYLLSGILYPYQNYFVREGLDRFNNLKFG